MNVYDFDKTIYDGDSSVDFYLFCLRKYPKILKVILKQIFGILAGSLGIISREKMKELYFSFLVELPYIDKTVEQFWEYKQHRIKLWYLNQKKTDDVIISASPDFLLRPICKKLNIKYLFASKINKYTGKFQGKNCKGKQKVKIFRENFKQFEIEKFYSDSLSDTPMAELSSQAFLVSKNIIKPWPILKNKGDK